MIQGFVEAIRAFQVRGWAVDADHPEEAIQVELVLGGKSLGHWPANVFRDDMRRKWKNDGRNGFIINLDERLPDSAFTDLVVRAKGPAGVETVIPRLEGIRLGDPTIPDQAVAAAGPDIRGFLASATATRVIGWACDTRLPDSAVRIDILVDDTLIASATADLPRPDIVAAGIGTTGRYGFDFSLPQPLDEAQLARVQALAVTADGRQRALLRIGQPEKAEEAAEAQAQKMLVSAFPGAGPDLRHFPVFVLGAARSGTSAMGQAISHHTRYHGHNEGHLLHLLGTLLGDVDRHFNDLGGIPGTLVEAVPRKFFQDGVRNIFKEFARAAYPSGRWMDKTPRWEMIQCAPLFREIWPNARFIFMKRRPVENFASRMRKFRTESVLGHCQDWDKAMKAWAGVRSKLSGCAIEIDQFYLSQAPSVVAKELAAFLDLTPTETMRVSQSLELDRPERSSEKPNAVLDFAQLGLTDEEQRMFLDAVAGSMEIFGYALGPSYFAPGREGERLRLL